MVEALRARYGRMAPWRLAGSTVSAMVTFVGLSLLFGRSLSVTTAVSLVLLPALLAVVCGWARHGQRVWRLTRQAHAHAHGEYTMRADDDGVYAATTVVEREITIPWTHFRHYVETVNLFVLHIDDRVGGMALLPKRGLRDGADVDALRRVVTRHLAPRSPGD